MNAITVAAIEKYMVGKYCYITFIDNVSRWGWVVSNDPKRFHADPKSKYLLLLDGGIGLIEFNATTIAWAKFKNGTEVPRRVVEL